MGQVELAQHRGGGGGIGRRDDGAERDRGGPGHVRHEPVRDDTATAGGGEADRDTTRVATGTQLSRRSRSEAS